MALSSITSLRTTLKEPSPRRSSYKSRGYKLRDRILTNSLHSRNFLRTLRQTINNKHQHDVDTTNRTWDKERVHLESYQAQTHNCYLQIGLSNRPHQAPTFARWYTHIICCPKRISKIPIPKLEVIVTTTLHVKMTWISIWDYLNWF